MYFDIYCPNPMNIYLGTKRSIGTNISKTAVFTMKEVFGPFFLVILSVTNLKEQFIMVHKLFWALLCKLIELIEHFLGPKMLLKT